MKNIRIMKLGDSLSVHLAARHLLFSRCIIIPNKVEYFNPETELKNIDVLITEEKIAKEFDLSFEFCQSINKNLICLIFTGYSSKDPNYKELPLVDSIIMSEVGVYKDMGINRQLMGVEASYSPLPLASAYGSIWGALAIMVALCKCIETSKGDFIEIPLVNVLLDTLIYNSMEVKLPIKYHDKRTQMLLKQKKNLSYQEVQDLKDPFYSHYFCKDGRPFYLVATCHLEHQKRTLKLLKVEKKVKALGIPVINSYLENKHGLGAGQVGDKWSKKLKHIFKTAFKKKTALEWDILFGKAAIPGVAHLKFSEWINSNHVIQSGLVKIENGELAPGPVSWLEQAKDQPINIYNQSKILTGITVIDISNVIAGPTISSLLYKFGAEVIKVDSTTSVYSPDVTVNYGVVANRGKRSILLDLTTKKGYHIFKKMIKNADILVANNTVESLKRLKLSPQDLYKINPHLILCRFDAWGGMFTGNRDSYLGYDDNLQASLGIMELFGGDLSTVEEHAHLGTIDVIAGVSGALSCVSALFFRYQNPKRTGLLTARASLASSGQILMYPFFSKVLGQYGINCKGEDDLNSLYQCRDGWVYIDVDYDNIDNDTFDEILNLTYYFGETSAEDVIQMMKNYKINCVKLNSIKEFSQNYSEIDINHPIGEISLPKFMAIQSKHKIRKLPRAPKYGFHTKEILKELNLDFNEFKDVISEQWSNKYLP